MGQAKLRKAEILELKAQSSKVKSNIDGFKPDAGMNSEAGMNHYWFQVAELIHTLRIQPKMRSYEHNGENLIEVNVSVDIMDREGNEQKAPRRDDGYFATFRFSAEQLYILAENIDKGAMAVRIDGVPAEQHTSVTGEKYRTIDVCDSYATGNHSGLMTYFVNDIKMTSKDVAKIFLNICDELRK